MDGPAKLVVWRGFFIDRNMTSDELKAVLFCVRWTYQHLGKKLLDRERIARREGQDYQPGQLDRCLKMALDVADRLERKHLPPKPEATDDESVDM